MIFFAVFVQHSLIFVQKIATMMAVFPDEFYND